MHVWELSVRYKIGPPAADGGERAPEPPEWWATLSRQPWWCWALGQAFHDLVCLRVDRGWADLMCDDLRRWRLVELETVRVADRDPDTWWKPGGTAPRVRGVEVMDGGGARRLEGDS